MYTQAQEETEPCPTLFGKSRKIEAPYAIYIGPAGFEWRILKTYKLAKNEDQYSRWLVAADPEWLAVYRPGGGYDGLPTPADYLATIDA